MRQFSVWPRALGVCILGAIEVLTSNRGGSIGLKLAKEITVKHKNESRH
jgi:hypothetical protein